MTPPKEQGRAGDPAEVASEYKLTRKDATRIARGRAALRLVVGLALASLGVWKLAELPAGPELRDIGIWLGVAVFGGGLATLGEILKAAGRGK